MKIVQTNKKKAGLEELIAMKTSTKSYKDLAGETVTVQNLFIVEKEDSSQISFIETDKGEYVGGVSSGVLDCIGMILSDGRNPEGIKITLEEKKGGRHGSYMDCSVEL